MPFTIPGRSAIPTLSNDQPTSKSTKRRSFLPHLSRHDDAEDKRIPSGRNSRSTNGTQEDDQPDDASSNGDKRTTVASAASRLRRPLSMMLNGESKQRPQSMIRPSTRGTDANVSAKSSLEVSAAKRAVARTGEGLTRSASTRSTGHARTASTLSTTSRAMAHKNVAVVPTSPSKLERPASRREPKPSFNNHQQQLSPSKRPATATAIARPMTAQPEEITAETAREQLELLQLSLWHERALVDQAAYESASKATLRAVHQRLRRDLGQIIGDELENERLTNLVAMSLWQSSDSYLMDRLRLLQKVHEDTMALVQDGSAFHRTTTVFRTWAKDAELTVSGDKGGYISALTESWRQGHASSTLRVQSLQLELATLPAAPQPSSVFTLMSSCQILLDGMLRELELMTQIEREVMRQDRARVDEAIADLPHTSTDTSADWIPRWQRVP